MKWLFWLLLAVNLVFFAYMQWGKMLTVANTQLLHQPPLNADKIKLLAASPESLTTTMLPPVAQEVAAMPSAVTVVSPIPPASDTACLEWGEFSGGDLKRASSALALLKLGEQLSRRQVEYTSGYWAYIPPPKTRAEIDKKISQLKARGVVDYFIVQEPGKWRNAISLGVFKTKDPSTCGALLRAGEDGRPARSPAPGRRCSGSA